MTNSKYEILNTRQYLISNFQYLKHWDFEFGIRLGFRI